MSEKAYRISLFSLEVSDTLLSLGAFDFKSHQHGGNESFEEHHLIKTLSWTVCRFTSCQSSSTAEFRVILMLANGKTGCLFSKLTTGWSRGGRTASALLFIHFLLSIKNSSSCLVLSPFYNFLSTQETLISSCGYLSWSSILFRGSAPSGFCNVQAWSRGFGFNGLLQFIISITFLMYDR